MGSPDPDPCFHAWLKCVYMCESVSQDSAALSWCAKAECSAAENMNLVISGRFQTPLHVEPSAGCWWFPLWKARFRGHMHPTSLLIYLFFFFWLETVNTALVLPSAGRGCAVFAAIKIHRKMESFICKTNNAEEIKHSGELSGPFKNQYEAFHLRPNLFLVIILHISCTPLYACLHTII